MFRTNLFQLIAVLFLDHKMYPDFITMTTQFKKFGLDLNWAHIEWDLPTHAYFWFAFWHLGIHLAETFLYTDWHKKSNGRVCKKSSESQLYVLVHFSGLIISSYGMYWYFLRLIPKVFQMSRYLEWKIFIYWRKQTNYWQWHMKGSHDEDYWPSLLKSPSYREISSDKCT